jgi:hypothetical protein
MLKIICATNRHVLGCVCLGWSFTAAVATAVRISGSCQLWLEGWSCQLFVSAAGVAVATFEIY